MANRYSTNYRMNRVLRDDRAALVVPIDHGLVWGRVPSLEAPVQVMRRFIGEDITGFMVSTGIVKQSEVDLARASSLARILAIDAFWPTSAPHTGTGTLVAGVEDAVRLGVDCVKLLLPWNVDDAEKVLYCQRIGAVVAEASRWSMPVMVEPVFLAAPRTPEIVDHRYLAFLADLWVPCAYHVWDPRLTGQSVDITYHARSVLPRSDLPPGTPLLVVLDTRASAGGFVDEDTEIWTPAGELLATTRQMRYVHPPA